MLIATIKEKVMNPFSAVAKNRLTHLATRVVADSNTRDAYLNAYDVENVTFLSCLQTLTVTTINRDTTDISHVNIRTIHDTIKWNNLQLSFCNHKKKKKKIKTDIVKVGSYQALMSAMNDSEKNPEDLVYFEVCDPPETMFDIFGNMRKGDKAVLLKSLRELVLSSNNVKRDDTSSACVMFDMMGVVQLLFPGMSKERYIFTSRQNVRNMFQCILNLSAHSALLLTVTKHSFLSCQ